jgi:hypothetical protein
MSEHRELPAPPPLDLSRWRSLPLWLVVVGGLGALIGAVVPSLRPQFAYSWLLAFMFYLSLGLGGWFLVLLHHLFDASWSVAIRRFEEHIAYLLPVMVALFIPIAILAPTLPIYPWMDINPAVDHSLRAKQPLFTIPMFYVVAVFCFGVWWLFSYKLRSLSLRQDQTGAAECTFALRRWSAVGIFFFAITLTLAAIMWMKALQHEWFSTMYGVYYFAGSVWTTIATVYALTLVLQRTGHLRDVVHQETYYFLGSLQLAFTVFYAYIHFSQYFIIWNANMPEETFWYVVREKGTWWDIGLIIIFGHFFIPFLLLLRIDWKLKVPLIVFMFVWAWLMHFIDLSFNIMPVLHPNGFVLSWLSIACMAFMGGVLALVFMAYLRAHPAFPQKDPRFAETLKVYIPPVSVRVNPSSPQGGSK